MTGDELVDVVQRAVADPASYLPRGEHESLHHWQARAVVKALTDLAPDHLFRALAERMLREDES